MKKQLAICAGVLLLGIGHAQAQAVYVGPGLPEPAAALPPYEIMSIVRSTGLAPLTRPMRRGPYYVLVAVDRVGRQMRVVVDAQLGDIVNMRPAMAGGPVGPEVPPDGAGPAPAYGARAGFDNNPSLTPPRPVPNTRAPNAAPPAGVVSSLSAAGSGSASMAGQSSSAAPPASRLAVAEPLLPPPPPLPRPRPKVALNEAPAAPPATALGDPASSAPTKSPAAPVAAAPAATTPAGAPNAAEIE